MNFNTQSLYKNRVEECLQEVQQQLDLSFNRIDILLESVSLAPHLFIPHKSDNNNLKLTQISFASIEKFANQLIQEVEPILKLTIHKQLQQNQQHLIQNQQLNTKQLDNHQLNSQPFTYNLMQNHSIQQSEWCYAIAINKDNSIVLAGCDNKIKVFEFKQEQLKLIQLLTGHQRYVTTLNFMKKSAEFISGSGDKQIMIWCMDQQGQWICQYKLNEHQYRINCLLLNNNEDLIISGSDDKTIKFWVKKNDWTCSQTITDSTDEVKGLSLNEKQNRVISCGTYMLFILIIEQQQQDQKWSVIQKITVDNQSYRIGFINDNVFTFQPRLKEQMDVYEMNSNNNQYSKTKQIALKSDSNACDFYFPQQYIKSKCLLVHKNGQNVNLIRKNQNDEFIPQQSIQFGHECIYGQVSEDGEYLMTWDYISKEIQIRKYQQLEQQ